MTEVSITSESGVWRLKRGGGRGAKIGGFKITVSDGETLDTGMDTVDGIGAIEVEATDVDANTLLLYVKSISGGVITFLTGKVGAYTNLTDEVAWLIVMGRVN
jgi:hypothetical protein